MRNREPVVLAQLIQTALVAVVGVLVSFGVWEPTPAQVGAITTVYVAVASIVTYWLRGHVYSPTSVVEVPRDSIVVEGDVPHDIQRALNRRPGAPLPPPE